MCVCVTVGTDAELLQSGLCTVLEIKTETVEDMYGMDVVFFLKCFFVINILAHKRFFNK